MNKIKILFLILSLNMGGTEKHISDLVSNLDRKKFNIVICCLYDLGLIGTKLVNKKEDIKIYHNLLRNKWDILGIWKLMRIIGNEKIRILYTINTALTQFYGTIFAKFFRMDACVTRVTATKPTYHPGRRMVVNKIMLPFVDKIIAQAYSHKEHLINQEGFDSGKIEVIHNGIELEHFNKSFDGLSMKQTMGVPAEASVIGIVARLAPEKGLSVFLEAAKKILDIFPYAHFLIVGDGEDRENLEEISKELTIQSNIHFLGTRRDIPQIISSFDIAVLTSYPVVETFSNSILEYMAAAKPVVATDAGSTSELVIDGETGFLIPCGDSDALADAISRLLKDRNLAKKMGEAGREKIKEKFTIQQMIAKYDTLFTGLVKQL